MDHANSASEIACHFINLALVWKTEKLLALKTESWK
jgi:hypothetical protein